MNMSKKLLLGLLIIAISVTALSVYIDSRGNHNIIGDAQLSAGGSFTLTNSAPAAKSIISERVVPKVIEVDAHALYPADLSNNRFLAGISHNIFVGKIVQETQSNGGITEFDVDVIKNIKGNLSGRVGVIVSGGYRNGVFYVRNGETYLVPGSTYLLATRYNSENSYRLVSFERPVGWKLLSQDDSLSVAQLQNIAQSDSRVKELQVAYTNETLDSADVYHNNVRNSYQSLTEAQKAALPYYVPPPSPPAPRPATSTASSTGN